MTLLVVSSPYNTQADALDELITSQQKRSRKDSTHKPMMCTQVPRTMLTVISFAVSITVQQIWLQHIPTLVGLLVLFVWENVTLINAFQVSKRMIDELYADLQRSRDKNVGGKRDVKFIDKFAEYYKDSADPIEFILNLDRELMNIGWLATVGVFDSTAL